MNAVSFSIQGGDYEHGGAASRSVKEQLKKVTTDWEAALHVDAYFDKPIPPKQLLDKIAELLRR